MYKYVASLLMVFFFASPLMAQDTSYYVSGSVGMIFPRDSTTQDSTIPGVTLDIGFESDLAYSGALGARRGQWRTEFEFGHLSIDADSVTAMGVIVPIPTTGVTGNVEALTGLVSGFYDFDIGHSLVPYVTAGFGFASVDVNTTITGVGTFNYDDTVIAWQVGAGVGYAINDRITLDAKYRYLGADDLEFGTVTSEVNAHSVLFGVRINF